MDRGHRRRCARRAPGLRRAAAPRRGARSRAAVLDHPRRDAGPDDDHRGVLRRAVRHRPAGRRVRDRRIHDRDPQGRRERPMTARLAAPLAAVLACAGLAGLCRPADADPTRYAVVVGNNHGDRTDPELRYAERDAERVASVLTDLGGFPAANVVVLLGGEADTLRSTVIAVNERIRSEHAGEALFVVYYSGHADAAALHLGTTTLAIGQLEQLVRGSAASFRLLALDSCRSGVLTRVKGGTLAPPIPITVADRFTADG